MVALVTMTPNLKSNNNFRRKAHPRTPENSQPKKSEIYNGLISITSRGVGYISLPNFKEDIEISKERTGIALNRDTVSFSILPKEHGRIQGKVVSILNRAKIQFVGTVIEDKGLVKIFPDDRKVNIFFTPDKNLTIGDKVFFKLGKWTSAEETPMAYVIRVLGKKGDNNVEMEGIALERGFDSTFDQAVLKEAENLRGNATEDITQEIQRRKDFRNIPTFTIDPKTAKDFDDAISIKTLANGSYEIGVHIADVSHYVRPQSLLDKEAQKRSVSVYLVDRTIPMLPEVLSSDLCSLNPQEDKLTFSGVFEIESDGKVVKRWFGRSIIRSAKRFTYEEAQEILDKKEGIFSTELTILNTLAKKLTKERFKNGAVSFEQDEVEFVLDSSGHPTRIFRKARKDSNKLVEEFMLLANREVASHVERLHEKKDSKPLFVYRIHDFPDPSRITELGIFLKAVGYELRMVKGKVTTHDLNALFKQIEGEAEEGMIKTAAIRSMAKAIYSTKNIGHYGLGFDYYTHFTSPIRRYADVLVHRLLQEYLSGKKINPQEFAFYEKMSAQVTECEIRAAEAERESIKLKQVEYMNERMGQIFDGLISGVTEWGLYIEDKETKSEGLVHIRNVGNEYYSLDEKNYALVGQKSKKKFSLGQSVKFKVTGADPEKRTLDYALVE